MKERIGKYLIYIVFLPVIGFFFRSLLLPITGGAHDGGFLGLLFGLMVGQLIFSVWLTNLRWYFSILFGFLMTPITIRLAIWISGILRDIYNPITTGEFFRDPDPELEKNLQWIFFAVHILSSIAIIEVLNKLITLRKQKHKAT